MNQKTGTIPTQFSEDPSVPETHEMSRASSSQIILMGDSKTPKSYALPSFPIPCQSSPSLRTPNSAQYPDIISKFNVLQKQTKDDLSRQKSLLSSIQSNYSFLFYKIRQLETGSNNTILWRIPTVQFIFDSTKSAHRQPKPIDDKTTGYWSPVFRTHPYGCILISDFNSKELTP